MSRKDALEYLEYIDELSDKEKSYIKKFYNELYFTDIYNKDDTIHDITDTDTKRELVRNTFVRQNDVFGESAPVDLIYNKKPKEQFMEDASDEWEWTNGFQQGGYELAVRYIFAQTIKDIENTQLNKVNTLLKFYNKMTKLRRLKERGTK